MGDDFIVIIDFITAYIMFMEDGKRRAGFYNKD